MLAACLADKAYIPVRVPDAGFDIMEEGRLSSNWLLHAGPDTVLQGSFPFFERVAEEKKGQVPVKHTSGKEERSRHVERERERAHVSTYCLGEFVECNPSCPHRFQRSTDIHNHSFDIVAAS